MGEGFVDLVAHFEAVEMNAWPYLCDELLRVCAVCCCHGTDGFLDDALDGASPPGMDGTDSMVNAVVEQHWDAVGCGHTDAHTTEIGHQRIDALQCLLSFCGGLSHEVLVDFSHLGKMYLMRYDELVVRDAQQQA